MFLQKVLSLEFFWWEDLWRQDGHGAPALVIHLVLGGSGAADPPGCLFLLCSLPLPVSYHKTPCSNTASWHPKAATPITQRGSHQASIRRLSQLRGRTDGESKQCLTWGQVSLTLGQVQRLQSTSFLTGKRWFWELEAFSCENGSFDKGLPFCDGDNQNEKISSWIKLKSNAKLKQLHFLFWHFPFKTPQNPFPAVWKCSFSDFFFNFFYLFHWRKRIWKCWHFSHEIFQALSMEVVPTSTLSKAWFLAPRPTSISEDLLENIKVK